jgi:hypothetical protein
MNVEVWYVREQLNRPLDLGPRIGALQSPVPTNAKRNGYYFAPKALTPMTKGTL